MNGPSGAACVPVPTGFAGATAIAAGRGDDLFGDRGSGAPGPVGTAGAIGTAGTAGPGISAGSAGREGAGAGRKRRAHLKGLAASLFLRTLGGTLDLETPGFRECLTYAQECKKRILYVIWHASQLVSILALRGRCIMTLASLSADGDIIDVPLAHLGYQAYRGSSSRGGSRALLGLLREMRSGRDCALTVDGPRGPARVAKPGAVLLAQKARAVVVPMAVAYARVHRLPSWDRFEIPWPFTRVVHAFGEPFQIDDSMTVDDGIRLVGERLGQTQRRADERMGR